LSPSAEASPFPFRRARIWVMTFFTAAGALLLGAPAAVPSGGDARLDSTEHNLLAAINAGRARHGRAQLTVAPALSRAADHHSLDMLKRNYFGHGEMRQRLRRMAPARRHGETLAYLPRGASSDQARQVVSMWLRSSGHRHVLLSRRFQRIGLGRRQGTLGSMRAVVFTADFSTAR